ncbi:MAG: hypothetical protein LBT89_09645, partial [Planctomycetaceae bacterium]|nr:hypothetical protein [Planctomycetaceae bacterium]
MRYHRLSDKKAVLILKCFCEEVTAVSASWLVGVSRNPINSYYKEIRERIFSQTLKEHHSRNSASSNSPRVTLERSV